MSPHHRSYIQRSWDFYGDGTAAGSLETHIDRHNQDAYVDIFQVPNDVAAADLFMSDDFYQASTIADPSREITRKQMDMIEKAHKMRKKWRLRLTRLMTLRDLLERPATLQDYTLQRNGGDGELVDGVSDELASLNVEK